MNLYINLYKLQYKLPILNIYSYFHLFSFIIYVYHKNNIYKYIKSHFIYSILYILFINIIYIKLFSKQFIIYYFFKKKINI